MRPCHLASNGNLTSDGATSMAYDAKNRLASATGATPASLSCDPMGRLFETSGGAPGTTQLLTGGDELAARASLFRSSARRIFAAS
jgi:hypothetical protein